MDHRRLLAVLCPFYTQLQAVEPTTFCFFIIVINITRARISALFPPKSLSFSVFTYQKPQTCSLWGPQSWTLCSKFQLPLIESTWLNAIHPAPLEPSSLPLQVYYFTTGLAFIKYALLWCSILFENVGGCVYWRLYPWFTVLQTCQLFNPHNAKFTETPTNMKAMASQAIGILYDAGKSIFNPFSSIWV